jgi:hypothetical protein
MKTLLFGLLACLVICSPALADGGYFSSYYPTPWWGYGPYGLPSGYYQDAIPYYAAHPPVYYSYQRIYRPYGDSPFPYLPGMSNAAADSGTSPRPLMVTNPYMSQESVPSPEPQPQTRTPLRITNPFVTNSTGNQPAAQPQQIAAKQKPLVVHPMAMEKK